MTRSSANKTRDKGAAFTGDKAFPLIDYNRIEILSKPTPGQKQVLINPRWKDKYTKENLAHLTQSIQIDGLQQPPIVRAITKAKKLSAIQLLAGNGRYHSIGYLVAENAWVYDDNLARKKSYRKGETVIYMGKLTEVVKGGKQHVVLLDGKEITVDPSDLLPTVRAVKKYAKIPCKVHYDIGDWHAMRLSFDENDKRRDLTVAEEMELVEYYLGEGFTQKEICALINKTDTWVSHTSNFRTALPKKALKYLLQGNIVRHVASNLLSYAEDERAKVFAAGIVVAKKNNKQKISDARDDQFIAEDAEAVAKTDEKQASVAGNDKAAAKAARERKAASKSVNDAKEKQKQIKQNADVVTQGDLARGAQGIGVKTKKPKPLTRDQIQNFITLCEKHIEDGAVDPVCKEQVPRPSMMLVCDVAKGILAGESDPLAAIRELHISLGKWSPVQDLDDISGPSDDAMTHVEEPYDADAELDDADEESFLVEYNE